MKENEWHKIPFGFVDFNLKPPRLSDVIFRRSRRPEELEWTEGKYKLRVKELIKEWLWTLIDTETDMLIAGGLKETKQDAISECTTYFVSKFSRYILQNRKII
jgi:hypothetical protein